MPAVPSAAQRRRTPGLLRIVAILQACAAGPRNFRELTGALDNLSASTLSRHLRQLVTVDFLHREGDASEIASNGRGTAATVGDVRGHPMPAIRIKMGKSPCASTCRCSP